MRKRLLVVLAVVLLVAIGGTIATVAVCNTPSVLAGRVVDGFAEDFLARGDLEPIVDVLTDGSFRIDISNIKRDGEAVLGDGSFSGKLYFSQEALMLSDFVLTLGEKRFVADAYLSKDELYIDESEILEGAYGIRFSELASELESSIFAPDSESDYAMDEDAFEKMIESLQGLDDRAALEKDANKLSKCLLKDVWRIIVKNADITTEGKDVRIGGKKTTVRMLSFAIDAEAQANIIQDVYDYLYEDDDIVEFIDKHEAFLVSVMTYRYGYDAEKYDSLGEAYEEYLEELGETVEELCEKIDDNEEDFPTYTVNFATPKASSTLLKLEVKADKEMMLSLDCGQKGIKKTNKIVLEVFDNEYTYEVKKNDKSSFEAELDFGLVCTIDIDKEREKYTVKMTDGERLVTTRGAWKQNGGTTTVTVNKTTVKRIGDDGEEAEAEAEYTMDCEMVFDASDKMPSPLEKFNTLSDIKEKDIDAWAEKIKDFLNIDN